MREQSPSFSFAVEALGECPACAGSLLSRRFGDVAYCHNCWTYCAVDRTTTAVYDAEYVAQRYERYATTDAMSRLRIRVLEAAIYLYEGAPSGIPIQRGRLLDVGYGNGSFIRKAIDHGWDAYGCDVNPTEYPGVRRVVLPTAPLPPEDRYRCITFFDAIEHFEDLAPARAAVQNTDWLMISVPRAPFYFLQREWRHRRPGEHHFYWYDPRSFERIFSTEKVTTRLVYCEHPEDLIRGKLADGHDNIMTVILRCQPTKDVRGSFAFAKEHGI